MAIPLLTYPTDASNTGQTLWAEIATSLLPNGIVPSVGNACNVYGDSTGLNVKVDTGRIVVGGFWADIQSLQTVTGFATPDASNPRIDRVVANLDTSSAAQVSLQIIQGTPAASPVPPSYGATQLPLARVQIRKLPNSTIAPTDVTQDLFASVSGAPIGAMMPFAGTNPPDGWLTCDGTAVSRTSYPFLFSTIGIAFGSGDGTTTFNVPDARGRVFVGADGSAHIFAATGGATTHTMTEAELARHTHGIGGDTGFRIGVSASSVYGFTTSGIAQSMSLTGLDYTGSSTPFSIEQPWLAANKIIRAH